MHPAFRAFPVANLPPCVELGDDLHRRAAFGLAPSFVFVGDRPRFGHCEDVDGDLASGEKVDHLLQLLVVAVGDRQSRVGGREAV